MINRPSRAGATQRSMQWLRKRIPNNRSRTAAHGFTLIELLVTLVLAAILGSLAAPSVRDFIVRSKLTNIGNEFTGSISKTRNEAVNRNTCVTLCMSANAGTDAPTCANATSMTKTDWHNTGWIIFLNPVCDSGITAPGSVDNMLLARPGTNTDYGLLAHDNKAKMTFNARGGLAPSELGQFDLIYKEDDDPLTVKFAFNICIDGLGRTRTIPSDEACATYH